MGVEPRPQTDAVRKLDELFEAYQRSVLAYAIRRTPTLADAEDAAAETFTIAWRKIQQLPDEPLPWLLAIARRVISNQRRGRQRRSWLFLKLVRRAVPLEPAVLREADEGDGPAVAALARLRPDDQELLRLVAWDELDHREVAQVLGISPNAVAVRLHRARTRFRAEWLKESGTIRTSMEQKGAVNGAMQERVE
jgi:RNA polymerase sigma-70 factor, ECF subfamily